MNPLQRHCSTIHSQIIQKFELLQDRHINDTECFCCLFELEGIATWLSRWGTVRTEVSSKFMLLSCSTYLSYQSSPTVWIANVVMFFVCRYRRTLWLFALNGIAVWVSWWSTVRTEIGSKADAVLMRHLLYVWGLIKILDSSRCDWSCVKFYELIFAFCEDFVIQTAVFFRRHMIVAWKFGQRWYSDWHASIICTH